jgi:phytoene dehydrogenase-like protein
MRIESTSYKVHLGLRRLPTFRHFDAAEQGFDYPVQVRIGPSVDYIEQAYDDSKYGRFSRRPVMTVMTPSVVDPTLAPPGMHLISIFAQHAPYSLRGRNWDDARDDLYETVVATFAEFAPDIRDCIVHSQTLTPLDYERIFDSPTATSITASSARIKFSSGGRYASSAGHATPVADLYLCGASTHPGGGVTGVPGHNAAQVVLRRLGRR